jgi:hypothetical protein
MRVAAVLGFLAVTGTAASAAGLDVASLPDSCKSLLAVLQNDKPRYKELGGVMAKAQKAKDMANFCAAAKQTVALIASESEQVDPCLGELAVDKSATPATVGQFTEVKNTYRKMLAAAKEPKNDHMKCGLAD